MKEVIFHFTTDRSTVNDGYTIEIYNGWRGLFLNRDLGYVMLGFFAILWPFTPPELVWPPGS